MSDLAKQQCVPCRGGVPPLTGEELNDFQVRLGGDWNVVEQHHLEKIYKLDDFRQALDFTVRVGEMAEEAGPPPGHLSDVGPCEGHDLDPQDRRPDGERLRLRGEGGRVAMTVPLSLLLAGSVIAAANLPARAVTSPPAVVAGRQAATLRPTAMPASTGSAQSTARQDPPRPRARDLGIEVGVFPPGEFNAITDVEGVLVGHATVVRGDSVRTGVTAIRPHGGNVFFDRVPAAIHTGNGFGKLLGVTQVRELGELETPVLLTCTLCVWRAADALVQWALDAQDMQGVRSINPVVGETNDGGLNDIRGRPVTADDVRAALEGAAAGPVEEGAVGAGTGTSAFGWKGGDRHELARAPGVAGRLHRRRAGAVQLRRHPADSGRAGRAGAGQVRVQRPGRRERWRRLRRSRTGRERGPVAGIDHDGRSHRRAAIGAQPGAGGAPRRDGVGSGPGRSPATDRATT